MSSDDDWGLSQEAMNDEANVFAMHLLMPSDLLRKDARGIDMMDDKALTKLANKYRVPVSVMMLRLGMLSKERDTPTPSLSGRAR